MIMRLACTPDGVQTPCETFPCYRALQPYGLILGRNGSPTRNEWDIVGLVKSLRCNEYGESLRFRNHSVRSEGLGSPGSERSDTLG